MIRNKTILVAPLNWGLGHATRCIPIIRLLENEGNKVIIASDGASLNLLKKEFPNTRAVALPGYQISYPSKGVHFKKKLLANSPQLLKAIRKEHNMLEALINEYGIDGVISDNRLGLYTRKVPTVYITHQLKVLSGKTTWLSTYAHNRFIKRFNECWVPDYEGSYNLSGALGHPEKKVIPTAYIGPLSRMLSAPEDIKYKVIAILSGPEPQRSLLEQKLLIELKKISGKVLLVQGLVEQSPRSYTRGNIKIVNFLTTPQLERAINSSEFVVSRSGYTSIMDLACMGKKAFFIPTPGQPEQEYLAKRLREQAVLPSCAQDDFKLKKLSTIAIYNGFNPVQSLPDLRQFFGLFKGKRKLRTHSKLALDIDFLFVRLYNMFNNRKTES